MLIRYLIIYFLLIVEIIDFILTKITYIKKINKKFLQYEKILNIIGYKM